MTEFQESVPRVCYKHFHITTMYCDVLFRQVHTESDRNYVHEMGIISPVTLKFDVLVTLSLHDQLMNVCLKYDHVVGKKTDVESCWLV